ncbi:hypothetical protein ILUMI_05849 [Ignelater luminosus]|uniref:PiggyBac transposable element-derived protein domain-containing protein n=1 Tax=Ignelater luminosus TaxID=2038154 RepID=A0A8K0DC93_IGNLU|nr:hypothetical protein ILUMI_05849 [Ignelater luminosus]
MDGSLLSTISAKSFYDNTRKKKVIFILEDSDNEHCVENSNLYNEELINLENEEIIFELSDGSDLESDYEDEIQNSKLQNNLEDNDFDSKDEIPLEQLMLKKLIKKKLRAYKAVPSRKKTKKWGVEIWVRAGVSGYMNRFEVYQAASEDRAVISNFGACADVVLRLSSDLAHKNHRQLILLNSIDRRTKTECLKSDKGMKREGRGSVSVVTTEYGNITVTKWMDNNAVHVASSCIVFNVGIGLPVQ